MFHPCPSSPTKLEDGTSTVFASLGKDVAGGVQFSLEKFGEISIGFNSLLDNQIRESSDLEFGVRVDLGGKLDVYLDGVIVSQSHSISLGSIIRLEKEEEGFREDQGLGFKMNYKVSKQYMNTSAIKL